MIHLAGKNLSIAMSEVIKLQRYHYMSIYLRHSPLKTPKTMYICVAFEKRWPQLIYKIVSI
jgi:hypothetical protein